MPIQYPASLDSLTNPSAAGGDTLASVPHDSQHADANDAVEALETKLGTGASTPATAGHVLRVTGPGVTAYGAIQEGDLPATVALDADLAAHEADTTSIHGIADTSTLATSASVTSAVSTHAGEADPHTGYQKESEKGVASGYASLDASAMVPVSQIRAVNSGTLFPVSPTTNDQFFRTDRGLLYYHDGTRWLTVDLFAQGFGNPDFTSSTSSSPVNAGRMAVMTDLYDYYLVDFFFTTYVVTTNTAANYWIATLEKRDGSTNTTVVTGNTSADAPDVYQRHRVSINALLGTGTDAMTVTMSKNGTPGSLFCAPMVTYRLVG